MLRTMNNEKALNCEIEYVKCFSKAVKTQNLVRFRDDLIMDMYDHNCTVIKDCQSDEELFQIIENEIALRKTEDMDYCNIESYFPISEKLAQRFNHKPQISIIGFYLFDTDKFSALHSKKDCSISKADNAETIADILHINLEEDGKSLGIDFCTRRVNRRADIYLSSEGVNAYICYDNHKAVGVCDLFLDKDVAKIEDFLVSQAFQRQGYGTAILKSIIEIALNSGASTIYLVTDEEDTAKEMYLKCGFRKIGEKTDLLFKL